MNYLLIIIAGFVGIAFLHRIGGMKLVRGFFRGVRGIINAIGSRFKSNA